MKLFDYEEALQGKAVCTESGLPVRILCCDLVNNKFPVVAAVSTAEQGEYIKQFTLSGKSFSKLDTTAYSLFMAPVKRSRMLWVNVYENGTSIFDSKEKAERRPNSASALAVAVPMLIEWEE